MLLIKCGSNGVYFKLASNKRLQEMGLAMPSKLASWSDQELFRETYVVKNFKSALAGGDTTIAVFLSAMLKNYNVYDSLKIRMKNWSALLYDL